MKALEVLELGCTLQVVMNGSKVILSFCNSICHSNEKDDMSKVIRIWSCKLHMFCSVFQSGTMVSGWILKEIIIGIYTEAEDEVVTDIAIKS